MKRLLLCLLLVTPSVWAANCGLFQPEWKSCKLDSDCSIYRGICSPAAANHRSVEAALKFAQCRSAFVDCQPIPERRTPRALCRKSICEAVYAN